METCQTQCVVVGAGPAGMMLGFLLARAGVDVTVMEKHADFIRDFRGDTIHPSTLGLIHELGLLEEFLRISHQETRELRATINGENVVIADFSRLATHCKFIVFMPQWDFLDFLAAKARQFPEFHLRMKHEVTDLLQENGRVTVIRAKGPTGEVDVRADLVIGADGRHAITRLRAHLDLTELGVAIDALWMRISKRPGDPAQSLGFFDHGRLLVLLDRATYWQCGVVIPKGCFEEVKRRGLADFHTYIAQLAPFLSNRTEELNDWSMIKLLTVQINRLRKWYRNGLLCIGDAAHAMSPAGGVGINLAIQDAVATANLLCAKLRDGSVRIRDLRAVQRRRQWPARLSSGCRFLSIVGSQRSQWPLQKRDFPSSFCC